MPTVPGLIQTRLSADAVLTGAEPAGLGFRIWDRWLKPCIGSPPPPGCTDEAFTSFAQGRRLKRNVVVLDGGEFDTTFPNTMDWRRIDTFPTTHIFAEAHQDGKQAAIDAYLRIESLLAEWDIVIGDQRLSLVTGTRVVLEDSPEWPGNVVVVGRWRLTGSRVITPA